MKSLFAIFMVVINLIFLMGAHSATAQDEVTRVRDSAFEYRQRLPVAFDHDAHNDAAQIDECNVCHHVYTEDNQLAEGESSEEQECSACHRVKKEIPRLALIGAFHIRCKGCHRVSGSGPVICNACHRGL